MDCSMVNPRKENEKNGKWKICQPECCWPVLAGPLLVPLVPRGLRHHGGHVVLDGAVAPLLL